MTEKGLKDAVSVFVYSVCIYVCMYVCELVANPTYTIYTAYRE